VRLDATEDNVFNLLVFELGGEPLGTASAERRLFEGCRWRQGRGYRGRCAAQAFGVLFGSNDWQTQHRRSPEQADRLSHHPFRLVHGREEAFLQIHDDQTRPVAH